MPLHEVRASVTLDSRTLYAIIDNRTGRLAVRPGDNMNGIGPEVTIRVATRDEAEREWQSPLHEGWVTSGWEVR